MKKTILFLVFILTFWGCEKSTENNKNLEQVEVDVLDDSTEVFSHPLIEAARKQIGKVVKYDTSYYVGAYPPADSGACTDLVERALFANNYDLKQKIDNDMKNFPSSYPHSSDPNINFRRVRNVKVFLEKYAESLPLEVNAETLATWKPGDIVTYDQIPGSLWHIAIVSDKKNQNGIPLLIHNYGKGVVEDDFLVDWPAPISGHFRLKEISL